MTEQQHDQVAATGTPADTSARAEGASDEPQAAGKGRAKKLTLLALKLAFTGAMLYVIFGKVLARDLRVERALRWASASVFGLLAAKLAWDSRV